MPQLWGDNFFRQFRSVSTHSTVQSQYCRPLQWIIIIFHIIINNLKNFFTQVFFFLYIYTVFSPSRQGPNKTLFTLVAQKFNNKVGHLLSELGFDPHSMLIRHHNSETLLLMLISKIWSPNSIANYLSFEYDDGLTHLVWFNFNDWFSNLGIKLRLTREF